MFCSTLNFDESLFTENKERKKQKSLSHFDIFKWTVESFCSDFLKEKKKINKSPCSSPSYNWYAEQSFLWSN